LFQSGIHSGFLAKIPGKGNIMAIFILVTEEPEDIREWVKRIVPTFVPKD
jgi:hypothetical protein